MEKIETFAGTLLQKVPLFFGFKSSEMKIFLGICRLSNRSKGEILCQFNSSSNRLFILLEGELDIVAQDGTVLATIKPITTVGEMGFINRKPRSATVWVSNAARLLQVDYHEFESLVESNVELRAKIFRNMSRILSDKLSDANDMVIRYRKLYETSRRKGGSGEETSAEEVVPPEDEDTRGEKQLRTFYELAHLEVKDDQLFGDKELYMQLRKDGYGNADIGFDIKWAVRNIPGIKRFSLVKLSINEALEDKWST